MVVGEVQATSVTCIVSASGCGSRTADVAVVISPFDEARSRLTTIRSEDPPSITATNRVPSRETRKWVTFLPLIPGTLTWVGTQPVASTNCGVATRHPHSPTPAASPPRAPSFPPSAATASSW